MSLTHGDVGRLDRSMTVDGVPRSGLIQTDAAVNPGNCGGRMIAADGSFVGLVDADRPAAVPRVVLDADVTGVETSTRFAAARSSGGVRPLASRSTAAPKTSWLLGASPRTWLAVAGPRELIHIV
jgi:hypothetical protein